MKRLGRWILVSKVGDWKAPFSLATTPRCRGWYYSIPWIAPLYSWSIPCNGKLSKVASNTILWDFGRTWPGITMSKDFLFQIIIVLFSCLNVFFKTYQWCIYIYIYIYSVLDMTVNQFWSSEVCWINCMLPLFTGLLLSQMVVPVWVPFMGQIHLFEKLNIYLFEMIGKINFYTIVIYWSLTEPSIKRWTCVNKRKKKQKQVGVMKEYRQVSAAFELVGHRKARVKASLQTEGCGSQRPPVEQPQPRCWRNA